MFAYDPTATLSSVPAPIAALTAANDGEAERLRALAEASAARVAAGRGPIAVMSLQHGHNLMRYRPEAVGAAILSVAGVPGAAAGAAHR
jgi:hypothetical protein